VSGIRCIQYIGVFFFLFEWVGGWVVACKSVEKWHRKKLIVFSFYNANGGNLSTYIIHLYLGSRDLNNIAVIRNGVAKNGTTRQDYIPDSS
jgi:hypothetical protein